PYFLQRFDINSEGALQIPSSDLETILTSYPSVITKAGEDKVEISWGGTSRKVEIQILPERGDRAPEAVFADLPPEGSIRCGAEVKYVHKR
ncbi:MAG: hypothetical protein N2445_01955, partial [Acidobacteria bacterium]|nr:hypothetical protein [Acidobacteriota bacterium]